MADQENDPKNPSSKKASYLRLVVSNSPAMPVQEEKSVYSATSKEGFTVNIYEVEDSPYALRASDSFHYLLCRLSLEIHDDEDEQVGPSRSMVCDFPEVLGEEFNDFFQEDEPLSEMVLAQFHMKLLEQMLLFASDHDALSLVVRINNERPSHALGIYRQLAVYEDKVPTIMEAKAHLGIPTNEKTFGQLIDLMDQAEHNFRQALWREQRNNSFVRWYLKNNPFLKVFC